MWKTLDWRSGGDMEKSEKPTNIELLLVITGLVGSTSSANPAGGGEREWVSMLAGAKCERGRGRQWKKRGRTGYK